MQWTECMTEKALKNINKALRAYVIEVGKGKHLGWGATA